MADKIPFTESPNNAYINKAKEVVMNYFNEERDLSDSHEITMNDVFIVWFCKTLQNWKALVSTNVSDGMYYEVTYNGDKNCIYLDAYKKFKHVTLEDV